MTSAVADSMAEDRGKQFTLLVYLYLLHSAARHHWNRYLCAII